MLPCSGRKKRATADNHFGGAIHRRNGLGCAGCMGADRLASAVELLHGRAFPAGFFGRDSQGYDLLRMGSRPQGRRGNRLGGCRERGGVEGRG